MGFLFLLLLLQGQAPGRQGAPIVLVAAQIMCPKRVTGHHPGLLPLLGAPDTPPLPAADQQQSEEASVQVRLR